jgi:hypothetical protein
MVLKSSALICYRYDHATVEFRGGFINHLHERRIQLFEARWCEVDHILKRLRTELLNPTISGRFVILPPPLRASTQS